MGRHERRERAEIGAYTYLVNTTGARYRSDPATIEFRSDDYGTVSVDITDAVRRDLRAIVAGWDADDEADSHDAAQPVCDWCGKAVAPYSLELEGGRRTTDWQHVNGGFRCNLPVRHYATVNGSEHVPAEVTNA